MFCRLKTVEKEKKDTISLKTCPLHPGAHTERLGEFPGAVH